MTAATRYHRNSNHVLERRLGEDLVLINLSSDEMCTLNPTAALVWEALAEPISRTELRDRMLAKFSGNPADIGADIDALLDRLAELEFVHAG